jgi:hypothetical protein
VGTGEVLTRPRLEDGRGIYLAIWFQLCSLINDVARVMTDDG